jgi:GT2 family glycosyltransferase
MTEPPELSVVLTLVDHQGHAVECVESWARRQELPRERYELIVVGSGGEHEVEDDVRPLLTEHDRLLRHESSEELELHDHGAGAARGRWLLFTEAHTVAEPTCLSGLLEYLGEHQSSEAGACIRSTPDGSTHPVAKCEQRWYAEGFDQWSREGDWRKVTVHGFAIRRDLYRDAGGFEHRFGCFAETALAATLSDRGHRLGYAPEAAVKHYDATRLGELTGYVRQYREGEIAYRATHPSEYCERYFGVLPPPMDRRGRIRAWLRYIRARARFWRPFLDDDERYARFTQLWTATSDREQQRAMHRGG